MLHHHNWNPTSVHLGEHVKQPIAEMRMFGTLGLVIICTCLGRSSEKKKTLVFGANACPRQSGLGSHCAISCAPV